MPNLEIGPGTHPLGKEWDTLDCKGSPTYLHDLRHLPLPVPSDKYDVVYMSHVLEHVPWFQTVDLLVEILRVLKTGGRVEIWVPDLEKLVQAYLNPELVHADGWYKFNPEKDPVKWFNGRMFTYGPDEENWHRAVFDSGYLSRCLWEAGFSFPKLLEKPRGYSHGWINLGMWARK